MTPIQERLMQAARLLAEIRELAAKNGAAFREEQNLPVARYYEQLASSLKDNTAFTMDHLLRHCEGEPRCKDLTVTPEEVDKSLEFVLRYLRAQGRLTEVGEDIRRQVEVATDHKWTKAINEELERRGIDVRWAYAIFPVTPSIDRLLDDVLAAERPEKPKHAHVQTSGPRCKQCHGFTTKTRATTHGLCLKCEIESK